jgi:O-antigen/teichoic acid export membrane protein
MFRLARSEVAVVMGGQVAQLAVGLATSTLIARMLNADGYGVVNLLRSIFMMAATVSPLGLDVALLKFCGRGDGYDPAKARVVARLRLLAFALSAAVVAGVWLGALAGLFGRVYPFASVDLLFVVSFLALPFATDTSILNAVYRARGKARRYALIGPYLQSALRLVLVPLAAVLSPRVETIVWINTLQIVVSAVLLAIDMRRDRQDAPPPPSQGAVSHSGAGAVLRESLWMCMSIFVYSLMRSADIMFLGASAGADKLGAYAALAMVSQLIAIFPMAASQSLGPDISRAYHDGDRAGVKRQLDGYLRKAAPVSGFLFGGIAVFGQRLDLIFGPSFHFTPAICLLLPLGQLLSATLAPMGYSLSMTGRHLAENAILTAGGVTLVALCAIFIPAYGAVAAAGSVAFTFFMVNVARFILVVRVVGAVPGRWLDLAPAPLAFGLAYLAGNLGDLIGKRDLPTTFFACCLYAVLFAGCAYGLFMDRAGRMKLARVFQARGIAS